MKSIAVRALVTWKVLLYGLLTVALLGLLGACSSDDPAPAATPTPLPQATPTSTPPPQTTSTADGSMQGNQPTAMPTAMPTAIPTATPTGPQPTAPAVTYEDKTVRLVINWPAGSSADISVVSYHVILAGSCRVIRESSSSTVQARVGS